VNTRIPASLNKCSEPLLDIITDFSNKHSFHGNFIIEKGSFADDFPDYKNIIRELEKRSPSVRRYALEYKDKNGRFPFNSEVLDYLELARNDIINVALLLKRKNEKVDFYVDKFIETVKFTPARLETLEAFRNESSEYLAKAYDPNDRGDLMRKMKSFKHPIFGDLGELDMVFRMKGVKWQSFFLGGKVNKENRFVGHYRKLFQNAKLKFLQTWEESSEDVHLSALSLYQYINKAIENKNSPKLSEIEKVLEWISSKEIDLVIEEDGRRILLVEVKNYLNVLSEDDLLSEAGVKKSIFTQQMEIKEILSILGLEKQFRLGIVFRRGITHTARKLLESNGIAVL
jgi:hypothetical protein